MVPPESSKQHRKSVSLTLKNVVVREKKHKKTLVRPVNAVIKGGSMFAILGGSGSGKTTLLNVIASKFDRNSTEVTGTIVFEGDAKCGYVNQMDYILPFLSVKETLMVAATLTMPVSRSLDLAVEDVIRDLGLTECANTLVGDNSGKRGISGGERRRLSCGIQIISDPNVLCADEPTR